MNRRHLAANSIPLFVLGSLVLVQGQLIFWLTTLIIILIAVVIVALGTLPGKIARKRGHPYPDAVNAASWIGLATGVFWPVAFIWAFLPVPRSGGEEPAGASAELAAMRQRVEELETLQRTSLHEPAADQLTFPSWRPRRKIDHIFLSESLEVTRAEVVDYPLSDHLPIAVEIALPDSLRLAA